MVIVLSNLVFHNLTMLGPGQVYEMHTNATEDQGPEPVRVYRTSPDCVSI